MDVIDIKGDGAASLMPLLTNWSLSDSEGMQSDRLSLTFSGMELHGYGFENPNVAQRSLSKWEKRKYAVQDDINSMRFHCNLT